MRAVIATMRMLGLVGLICLATDSPAFADPAPDGLGQAVAQAEDTGQARQAGKAAFKQPDSSDPPPAKPQLDPNTPQTVQQAVGRLLGELTPDGGRFGEPAGGLFLHVDCAGDRRAPLAALIERETRMLLTARGLFATVVSAEDLPFDASRPDAETLAKLERVGLDRVLDISAEIKGERMILRGRVLWLIGGSWAPLLAQPVVYPESRARIDLPADPQWVILAKPAAALGRIRLSWERKVLLSAEGRVLAVAAHDIDRDGYSDVLLLFADRLELWVGTGEGVEFKTVMSLGEYTRASGAARFATGSLVACGDTLLVGGTNLRSGLRLGWSGTRFGVLDTLDGVPIGCNDGAALIAPYQNGSHLLQPLLLRESGEAGAVSVGDLPDGALIGSINPAGGFVLDEAGRVFPAPYNAALDAPRCGLGVAALSEGGRQLLACSEAKQLASADAMRLFAFEGGSLRQLAAFDAEPGAIFAAALAPSPTGARVFAAVYDVRTHQSTLIVYQR